MRLVRICVVQICKPSSRLTVCVPWLQIYLQLADAQQKQLLALKAELAAVKAAAEAAGGDANAAKAVGMRAYKECARIKVSDLHDACLRPLVLAAHKSSCPVSSNGSGKQCPPVQVAKQGRVSLCWKHNWGRTAAQLDVSSAWQYCRVMFSSTDGCLATVPTCAQTGTGTLKLALLAGLHKAQVQWLEAESFELGTLQNYYSGPACVCVCQSLALAARCTAPAHCWHPGAVPVAPCWARLMLGTALSAGLAFRCWRGLTASGQALPRALPS